MEYSKPLVSVLMIAYNAENFISEAIESILNQTFSDFEFIILDDHSTDNSYEVINEYAKKDNRILVLHNEKNLGIAESRTKCIKYAKGKYIAIADADDISFPTRFEKQLEYLEKHKDCGVVGSFIELFNSETGKIIGFRKYHEDDVRLRKRIFIYSPIAQPASMIRKEVFDDIGFYNPEYPPVEDLDIWFRLGTKYKFANIPEVLIKYRVHQNSATIKNMHRVKKLTLQIRQKYKNGYGYSYSFFDRLFLFFLRITRHIIPGKLTFQIFSFFRDEK
jgi:glycosyltransferase involved in cell wall biosynthesis